MASIHEITGSDVGLLARRVLLAYRRKLQASPTDAQTLRNCLLRAELKE